MVRRPELFASAERPTAERIRLVIAEAASFRIFAGMAPFICSFIAWLPQI